MLAIDPAMADGFQHVLDRELDVLRSGGARVELIVPDAASVQAFGPNPMDPRKRKAAARELRTARPWLIACASFGMETN